MAWWRGVGMMHREGKGEGKVKVKIEVKIKKVYIKKN